MDEGRTRSDEGRGEGDTEEMVAVVARSDASEWENIVDYPSPNRP